jgi:hypothetical protein
MRAFIQAIVLAGCLKAFDPRRFGRDEQNLPKIEGDTGSDDAQDQGVQHRIDQKDVQQRTRDERHPRADDGEEDDHSCEIRLGICHWYPSVHPNARVQAVS